MGDRLLIIITSIVLSYCFSLSIVSPFITSTIKETSRLKRISFIYLSKKQDEPSVQSLTLDKKIKSLQKLLSDDESVKVLSGDDTPMRQETETKIVPRRCYSHSPSIERSPDEKNDTKSPSSCSSRSPPAKRGKEPRETKRDSTRIKYVSIVTNIICRSIGKKETSLGKKKMSLMELQPCLLQM